MTCPQIAYRQRLAPVAKQEVARARANGVYQPSWDSKPRGRSDDHRRAGALDLLHKQPMTTKQLRAKLQSTLTATYSLMRKMERAGLVSYTYVDIDGNAQALWRLADREAAE